MRRTWTALAVVALATLALAAPIPGGWKMNDGGKVIGKKPTLPNVTHVIITNEGADSVLVSAKGVSVTKGGTLNPGEKGSLLMPNGSKAVVLKDANPGNGAGSKGVLVWAAGGLGQGGTGNNGDLIVTTN